MAHLRHFMIGIGAAALIGCSAPAPGETTSAARPSAPARATPTPTPPQPQPGRLARVAPEWQSRIPDIDPAQVAQTLRQAADALARGQLERGTSPGPGALELYLAALGKAPDNESAQAGVYSALDALLERGHLHMRAGRLAEAERIELITRSLLPEHLDLPGYQKRLVQARAAEELVAKAETAVRNGDLVQPAGRNAVDVFHRALAIFPDYAPARTAMHRLNVQILSRAWKAAEANDFAGAQEHLQQSHRLLLLNADARVLGLRIMELRQKRTDTLLAQGNSAVDRMRLSQADSALQRAGLVAAQDAGIARLRERIHIARHYGPFQPREVFSERLAFGGAAPEMVVIPYGRFRMGASLHDGQRRDDELPGHEVNFARGFAIARNEVTVADFRRFVQASKYRSVATRSGSSTVYDEKGGVVGEHEGVDWRRDHVGRLASPALPVVHVAFEDAQAYAAWVSKQTGARYSLPSEAQFEYVLRGGSDHVYPWGNAPPRVVVGNLAGDGDLSRVGRRWGNAIPGYRDAFWGPAPVRNFPAERLSTFDLLGNVSEWTLDCWHDSYQRAPVDGSAWVNPGCPQRVVRGASWESSLDQARSASRLPVDANTTTARTGFRLVREL